MILPYRNFILQVGGRYTLNRFTLAIMREYKADAPPAFYMKYGRGKHQGDNL